MSDCMKVLIADDNTADQLLLRKIVEKEGHQVVLANDGCQAVELFEHHQPDLILLDALMPNMDGFTAAKIIKDKAGDNLVPIIFLTSLQDAQSLARCLDCGGDDFLSKPYNRIILKAKMNAFKRMRIMHSQIQQHHHQLLVEQQVAKKVFDNVTHSGSLGLPNIKCSLSPMSVFNGDTLLASRRPNGNLQLLLADFTGHGLPAAIGAMPMADIFYGMTEKGFGLVEIIRELNAKLNRILPIGVSSCAALAEFDFLEGCIRLWNGGLPDCVIYRAGSGAIETLASMDLPLGVVDGKSYNPRVKEFKMARGDRLFIWSDGILECRNAQGEMFGQERLYQIISQCRDPEHIFAALKETVHNFMADEARDDDLTLAEITMVDLTDLPPYQFSVAKSGIRGPKNWQVDLHLHADTLKAYNPIPLIVHILTEVEGLRAVTGQLYTLVAELYANALDHGLLQIDSSMKNDAAGFTQYYKLKEERLAALAQGHIIVRVQHQAFDDGGELILEMEDSGQGFDYHRLQQQAVSAEGYCGRGLPLLRTLCKQLDYLGKGNIVRATLRWPTH